MHPHSAPLPYYGAPADRWPAGSFQTGGNDLGMLLLFAFALLLLILVFAFLFQLARRKSLRAIAKAILAACVLYAAILLGAGISSSERSLPLGAMKCSDDWCVAVLGADRPALLAAGAQQVAPSNGQFIVVNVRVFNNARRAAMRGSTAGIFLFDSRGNRYAPSARAQGALEQSAGPQLPLDSKLGPGEWLDTKVAFDVPASASGLRVAVGEGLAGKAAWINRFVPFDESSPFHKKIVYPL
jgi:hypothetical protein